MKKVLTLKYGEFETDFYVTPKVEIFLNKMLVKPTEYLPDEYHFYEVSLFELLDEDGDGIPDKKFGREFEVIYYAVSVSHRIDVKDKVPDKKILGDWQQVVSETKDHKTFSIKYKMLKKP